LAGEKEQFTLYQWITADIQTKPDDSRPESDSIDCDSMEPVEVISPTQDEWGKPGRMDVQRLGLAVRVRGGFAKGAKEKGTSIGVVAPREIKKVEVDCSPVSCRHRQSWRAWTWWPGTQLNRRLQPFQSVTIPYFQQLAGHGRLRKFF
jgi:hypothetical protein